MTISQLYYDYSYDRTDCGWDIGISPNTYPDLNTIYYKQFFRLYRKKKLKKILNGVQSWRYCEF